MLNLEDPSKELKNLVVLSSTQGDFRLVDIFSMLQLLAKKTHVKESLVVVPIHMWPHIPIIGNFEIKGSGQEGWNKSKKLKGKEKEKIKSKWAQDTFS